MLKYMILPVLSIALNLSALELNQLETGQSLLPGKAADNSRARLFTDTKPAPAGLLRPYRKDSPLTLAVDAVAADTVQITVPPNATLPFSGGISTVLDFKSDSPEVTTSFSIKFENFQQGKGGKNLFAFLIGGVNLQFRADTRDLRYFDGTKGKYVRLLKLKENEWYPVSITVGPETFSLNELKDIKLRGKPSRPHCIIWNSRLDQGNDAKPPVIQLKDIKVK